MKHIAAATGLTLPNLAPVASSSATNTPPKAVSPTISDAVQQELQYRQQQDERSKNAETALNAVYTQLRAKLNANDQDLLKQEQLKWLNDRNDLMRRTDDQAASTHFTEQRTQELQRRLGER